jgi:hypothetical protein
MYPYRAYIETLLSYGPAAKESQLTSVMWYKDTPGQQDKRTKDNKGFTSRKELTATNKKVLTIGRSKKAYHWWDSNIGRSTIGWFFNSKQEGVRLVGFIY